MWPRAPVRVLRQPVADRALAHRPAHTGASGPTVPRRRHPCRSARRSSSARATWAMFDRNAEGHGASARQHRRHRLLARRQRLLQGSAQQFRDCYEPTWGRHKSRRDRCTGNHEYESPKRIRISRTSAPRRPARPGLLQLRRRRLHVIALNSQIPVGAGTAQESWLRSDLAANRTRCTIAYWHYPLFTSGRMWPLPAECGTSGGCSTTRAADVVSRRTNTSTSVSSPTRPRRPARPRAGPIRQFNRRATGGALVYPGGRRPPPNSDGTGSAPSRA
jgi:hypothetical protein